jgi:Zn-dependent protease with chaperone function
MSDSFAGTYYDGVDGRTHAVLLRRVGGAHYAIEGEGVARSGSIASLGVTPRLARIARTIEFGDGARLLLAHDAPIDAWFPKAGAFEAFVDRLERHAYAIAVAVFVCATTLVVGALWGVPKAADAVAFRVPPEAERTLGDEVLEQLDRFGLKETALDEDRRDALAARFAALAGKNAGDYRLEFRSAPGIGANAFAIPGGTVVVTDQLVAALDDDREFDAVVAHEIGHQRRRHALRQTLRGSAVAIVAAFFAGDVSSAGAIVVAVPTFLLTSHYSREFEDEADRYAFELLAQHEESPHWFAEAMRRLEAAHPAHRRGLSPYVSTHPDTSERIDAADAAASAFATAHPELCPNGNCPGEEGAGDADDSGCEDCDDDEASARLDCGKDAKDPLAAR